MGYIVPYLCVFPLYFGSSFRRLSGRNWGCAAGYGTKVPGEWRLSLPGAHLSRRRRTSPPVPAAGESAGDVRLAPHADAAAVPGGGSRPCGGGPAALPSAPCGARRRWKAFPTAGRCNPCPRSYRRVMKLSAGSENYAIGARLLFSIGGASRY